MWSGFWGLLCGQFCLRHPHLVGRTIGISGFYDISKWSNGYSGEPLYENNPFWFIENEHDTNRIRALQRMDIILTIGEDDPACANNGLLSKMLWDKEIGNALRIWDGPARDWATWIKMLRHYIGGHD